MPRRKTGVEPKDEVELTEITKAEIVRVDGVLGPANGTPTLLMKSLPDDGKGAEVATALAKAVHGPFTGKHSHVHPAMGSQDGDETHEHEHSHDGDADHGHSHAIEKAEMSGKAINDLPDSAFAHIEAGGEKETIDGKQFTKPRSLRHFPVHDEAHARNALARAPQSPFGDKAMPKIRAAAKKFGIEVSKADGEEAPGSPTWEAQDAAALRSIAAQLADIKARLCGAREREAAEGDDWDDADDLDCAVQAVECALSIAARLAFTEQTEAMKPDDMQKAGRRLSSRSVQAIKTARDHLSTLLGPDGEEPKEENDVTSEQVEKMLDEKLGPILKALQAGTVNEPTSTPEPAGASVESGTGEADAEESRQNEPGPGHQTVPQESSTPALAGEPQGGLPSGVPTPEGAKVAPAGGEMARVKSAETASDANPALVKSTETPQPQALDVEALAKSLLEPVMKSVQDAVAPLKEGLEAVTKQVETIANQPLPGGPLLKGAPGQQFDYLMARREGAAPGVPQGADVGELLKAVEGIENPVHRAQITRALAVNMHPALKQT